jgi:riboflavin kinase/FMN adenylyltransferase
MLGRKKSPLLGIYAVKVYGLGTQVYYGVANIGNRPTVDKSMRVLLEVHLFDFDQMIYGKQLQIEFCSKLRDEKKFADFEALKAQILLDAEQAKTYFANLKARA